MRFFVPLFLLCVSQIAFGNIPSDRALAISRKQPHLMNIFKKLEHEINSIKDISLRKDIALIVKGPAFRVIGKRKKDESAIIKKLQENELLGHVQSLFPKSLPVPFLAASGSPWPGHHSYPGGLVYHTYTNLRLGLQYAQTYSEIYGVRLNRDWIRLAALWHDAAKTLTLPWNSDGTCAKEEVEIAGTSAHHILAIAEALFRKYPSEFVVILASAHSSPLEGQDRAKLIGFLKAGAIIAGVPYTAAGLSEDGSTLSRLPPIEAFVNHLDDHDYVLTQASIDQFNKSFPSNRDYWKRNELLSAHGDLLFYSSKLSSQ